MLNGKFTFMILSILRECACFYFIFLERCTRLAHNSSKFLKLSIFKALKMTLSLADSSNTFANPFSLIHRAAMFRRTLKFLAMSVLVVPEAVRHFRVSFNNDCFLCSFVFFSSDKVLPCVGGILGIN